MLDTQLHLVDGVVILLAAAIPIYLTVRLKNDLRKLTAILSIFILIHAVYCWLDYFGFDLLSDGVFEPLSAAALLFFGISYYGIAKRKDSIKKMVAIWTPITFIPLMDSFTIILLLAALSIFVWLATRAKKIRSFQFQISIFIIIWVLGQVAGSLQDDGIITLSPLQGDIGLEIHVVSLVFFSIMIWLRFYYSHRSLLWLNIS
jgi:D-alanyl-lipoteichoic acid acyltransferase DltB (MBOAT superfamily)